GGELTHQPDDRAIRVEVSSPEARLGESGAERAYDNVELFTRELVERQPLAEHPAWCQALRHRVVHLARIEIPSAGMPWDKEIGHDDVKAVATGGQIAAAIVEHEAHVRPCVQLPVPWGKMRACRLCHLGHEFNDSGLRHAERGSGARRDTRSEPDERDTARVGV